MAKPEKIAPATKYGGKMVVCQPGITEVAKSKDTMVCTESTRGWKDPLAPGRVTRGAASAWWSRSSRRRQLPYKYLRSLVLALSRTVAKSGSRPEYQNSRETVKYVEIANTSQQQRGVEVHPQRAAGVGVRHYKEGHPYTAHVPDRELAARTLPRRWSSLPPRGSPLYASPGGTAGGWRRSAYRRDRYLPTIRSW